MTIHKWGLGGMTRAQWLRLHTALESRIPGFGILVLRAAT